MNPKDKQAPVDRTAGLTEDDLAAALGYHTTLSEPLVKRNSEKENPSQPEPQQQEEQPQQEQQHEAPQEPGDNAMGKASKHDEYQDKEIADIRAQLTELMAQETGETPQNGQETENTGTPQ